MSGEKIQRYAHIGITDRDDSWIAKTDDGDLVIYTDHLAALASRDATIKTQGETIERLRGAIQGHVDRHNYESKLAGGPDVCLCLSCERLRPALAPGVKSAKELEWRCAGNVLSAAGGYGIHDTMEGFRAFQGDKYMHPPHRTLRAAMLACERHAASVPQAEAEERP